MTQNSLDWKLLKSEQLHKDRWLSVRVDSCEMPNGTIVEPYYVMEYPDWVAAIALTDDNEVVLVRQYRHGIGKTGLELPCGCVDPQDASPQEAIKRELQEETGYLFKNYEFLGSESPNPSNYTNLHHAFLATGVTSVEAQQLDESEQIEVVLKPFDEFLSMAKNGEFTNSLHVSSIFYLLCKLGKI